jgi:hypothetical protein
MIKHLTGEKIATLMKDKVLTKGLTGKKSDLDAERGDCDILEAAINQGMSKETDKLINALHTIQKTGLNIPGCDFKVKPDMGMAMAGGADGMKTTRAAFAIMIKFSDLLDDFQSMQDSVADVDGNAEIKETIAFCEKPEEIINCWKSASK